jgi:hypothetical protein
MPQGSQNLCLTLELASVILREKRILLNRHRDIQVFVYRAIDGSHSPLAKDVHNPISLIKQIAVL